MTLSKGERTRLGDLDTPRAGGAGTRGLLDASGRPLVVQSVNARPMDSYEARMMAFDPKWASIPGYGGGHADDDDCGCDQSLALQHELAIMTAERDYMLTGLSPSEIRTMRQELAKQWEATNLGALAPELQTNPDGVVP